MEELLGIYLVSQNENIGYGTYDSFICIAHDKKEAANMLPIQSIEWDDEFSNWASSTDKVTVTYLGLVTNASKYKNPEVILTSFNAG